MATNILARYAVRSALPALLLGLAGAARAQVGGLPPLPGAPAAAAPAVPAVAAPAAPAAAAPQQNLWSFFCLTPDQKAACEAEKLKFCQSQIGQLIHNSMLPVGAFTGGLVPQCCPGPEGANPADLAKPATGAEGAAARIQKEEADAKARRAAVRYLGTVECRRYPEAEVALINALRQDGNECVRWEAAIALSRGCCCTKKTIEALTLTVEASTKDGNPPETSPRVRAAAAQALDHCVACYVEPAEGAAPEPRPEPPPAELVPPRPLEPLPTLPAPRPAPRGRERAAADPVAEARQALARYAEDRARHPVLLTGQMSVYEALASARGDLPPLPRAAEVSQVAATAAPPESAPPPRNSQPVGSLAPPTGQRSVSQIFLNAFGAQRQ